MSVNVRFVRVAAVCALALAPITACASNSGEPTADGTGPVTPTAAQKTPQALIYELLQLREQGKPQDAARYFISNEAYPDWNDLKGLTEVNASILCTSSRTECARQYSRYVNGEMCPDTTAEDVKKSGVTQPEKGRPLLGAYVNGDDSCGFDMVLIGNHWWLASG